MTAADKLLSRLDGVRELPARPGRTRSWRACCPAHADKRPSLDVDQLDDRVLVCCRVGCSTDDIVGALGLELRDLFDHPTEHWRAPVRNPLRPRFDAAETLTQISHEALVVVVIAEQLARVAAAFGAKVVDDDTHRRLIRAANTITAGVERSVRAEPPEIRRLRRGEGKP